MARCRAACVAALLLLAAAPVRAQDTVQTPVVRVYHGRIIGVYDNDTGQPIEGVIVRDVFTGLSALTTKTGTVSLFFVDTSGGMISFRKLGYEPVTVPIANALTDTIPVEVMLTPVGTVLPTVVTNDSSPHYLSPGLQEFEARRKNGMGYYISEAELRKKEGEPLALVFPSYIPSATVNNGYLVSAHKACSGTALGSSGRCTPCYATVYTDGVLTYKYGTPGAKPPDFSHISTDDYAGVEYYGGGATLPPGISPTNADCGVLLLWTRER